MKTRILNFKALYPNHPLNGESRTVLIENNRVIALDNEAKDATADREIDAQDLLCFPALMDAQCSVGEPGFEYKEDFQSLTKAARNGGFSSLAMTPETDPIRDSSAQVKQVIEAAEDLDIDLLPYGTISKGLDGNRLAEMYDLHKAGAIGFSDGKHPVKDVNMMKRALEYARGFDGLICSFPLDMSLNPGGIVHEGLVAAELGLKTSPALSEELMIIRDLHLLEYTKSKLHFSTISTSKAVELIRNAKGHTNLSAAVALPNLLFSDSELKSFDTNFKTNPPLRDGDHIEALLQGLIDGTIDMIVTDHTPENPENKEVEFDHASPGMIMLETALALINMKLVDKLSWETIIKTMAINPRLRFGQKLPELNVGSRFDFTLFDTTSEWVYDKTNKGSKSENSPFYGKSLKGQVIQIH